METTRRKSDPCYKMTFRVPAAFALLLCSSAAHAGPHVVSWVSEPVLPGETALALVVGPAALGNNSVVEVRGASARTSDWRIAAMSRATLLSHAVVSALNASKSVRDQEMVEAS